MIFNRRPAHERPLAQAATILGIAFKDGQLRPKVVIHGLGATVATPIEAAQAIARWETATASLVVEDSTGRRFSIAPKANPIWVDKFITALAEYRAAVNA